MYISPDFLRSVSLYVPSWQPFPQFFPQRCLHFTLVICGFGQFHVSDLTMHSKLVMRNFYLLAWLRNGHSFRLRSDSLRRTSVRTLNKPLIVSVVNLSDVLVLRKDWQSVMMQYRKLHVCILHTGPFLASPCQLNHLTTNDRF